MPQTVTVTAVQDTAFNDDVEFTVGVGVDDAKSADEYDVLPAQSLSGTVANDDIRGPGFSFSTTNLGSIAEGGTGTFAVNLGSEPTSNVVLTLSSTAPGRTALSETALTFTPGNWDMMQTVTVTAEEDDIANGDAAFNVAVGVGAASSADEYDALPAQLVTGTVTDNDVPGLLVSIPDSFLEGGETTLSVSLRTRPEADVTLTVATPATATATPSAPTFTPENWNVAQSVAVSVPRDGVRAGDRMLTLTVSVAGTVSSRADGYGTTLAEQTSVVTVREKDVPGFELGETEGGSISVSLFIAPTADLTLTVTHGGGSDVTVTPAELVFSSGATEGEISVEGSGVVTVTVAYAAGGGEAGWASLMAQTFQVSLTSAGEPAKNTVMRALTALDGAGGAQLVGNLIAARMAPAATNRDHANLGGTNLLTPTRPATQFADDAEASLRADPFGDRHDGQARQRALRALAQSSFSLQLADDAENGAAFWGAASLVDLDIKGDAGTAYKGETVGAGFGIETRLNERLSIGLAVGISSGELDVSGGRLKRVERDSTSVHPYLVWNSGDLDGWLAAGIGSGGYEAVTENERAETDVSTTMLAGGVSKSWLGEKYDMVLRASAVGSKSELDDPLRLGADTIDGDASFLRMRAEFELGREFQGAEHEGTFRPYLVASGRNDSGDGPEGSAAELGLGLSANLKRSLSAEIFGRVQVTEADLDENSLTGSFRYDADGDRRGLLLGARSIWSQTRDNDNDNDETSLRLEGRVGYGWATSLLGRGSSAEMHLRASPKNGQPDITLESGIIGGPVRLDAGLNSAEIRLGVTYRF